MIEKNRITTCGAAFAAMQSPIAATIATAYKPLLFTGMKPLAGTAIIGIGKSLAATSVSNAFREDFATRKTAFEAYSIKPVVCAFKPIVEQIRAISEICYCRSSNDYGPTNEQAIEESKLYVPTDKEIIINHVIIPVQRKRGNITGSVPNYAARDATEQVFFEFIRKNEKYLLDFTREQIKFFVKKIMKDRGLEEYFHNSYFYKLYQACPDVNHKAGNHHGAKNKPEIVVLVETR